MKAIEDRCATCGANHEEHGKEHLCRAHRETPDAPCEICGSVIDNRRGLVCVFCGEGFDYEGQAPDEATLRTAVEHEKDCPKNPYKAELARLRRIVNEIHDTFYGQGMEVTNYHLNGELEPLDNFFESADWEVDEEKPEEPRT